MKTFIYIPNYTYIIKSYCPTRLYIHIIYLTLLLNGISNMSEESIDTNAKQGVWNSRALSVPPLVPTLSQFMH